MSTEPIDLPGPDHRAEVPILTQAKAFWRTALQIGPAALLSLVVILPVIIQEFVDRFNADLPEGFRLWLLGVAGFLTLLSSIIAWFMANPRVLEFTRKYAPFFSPTTK